jgi:hypothetical protein
MATAETGDGPNLQPSRWTSPQTYGGGQITREPNILIMTSADYDLSGGEIYTPFQFTGDFDVQVDYRASVGWSDPFTSSEDNQHLDAAGMGVYLDGSTLQIMHNISPNNLNPLHILDIYSYTPEQGFRLPASIDAVNKMSGKHRIIRTGSDIEFKYYTGTDWQTLYTVTGLTKPVYIYLSAQSVDTKHAFSTTFENFQINSGKTTYTPRNAPAAMEIRVEPSQAISKQFLGIGTEWNSCDYTAVGMTSQDFDLIKERLDWMKMPITRVMMVAGWATSNGNTYNFDSQKMQNLYKILDYCQQNKMTVILTEWGIPALSWATTDWDPSTVQGSDDPMYAKIIGACLNHLINTKGYTCIKYLIFVNEPNYEAESYDSWKSGIQNIAAELDRRGLSSEVTIMGSDNSNAPDWHRSAVKDLKDVLGGYDFHDYAMNYELISGSLKSFIADEWSYASNTDVNAASKPFIIGEAGMGEGASTEHNTFAEDYIYGVWMTDYAVQALQAGSSSVIAWMLDDNSHSGFTWGLWEDRNNGMGLKPWFYTWSLLTRYLQLGSTIYDVSEPLSDVRVLAARSPSGDWTFVAVNRGSQQADITFNAFGSFSQFNRYLYSEGQRIVDSNGFPAPASSFSSSPMSVKTNVPAESVVVITSVHSTVNIDQALVSDNRCDIGYAQNIYFHASWSDNGSDVGNGSISTNGKTVKTNSTGWTLLEVKDDVVGSQSWNIDSIDCYGITSFKQTAPAPTVIYDRVKIIDSGVSNNSASVNQPITVWLKAVYEYDGEQFDDSKGTLKVNDSPMSWSSSDQRWEKEFISSVPKTVTFKVTKLKDTKYGLTTVIDSSKTITVDWKQSGIPGFPFESLVYGVLLGLVILSVSIRKQRHRIYPINYR